MFETELRLSFEEAAVASACVGQPTDAETLLRTVLTGDVAGEEIHSRLLAAGHSLLARGLLALGDGQIVLREDLALAARALARPLWSLSYRRVTAQATFARAYHFTVEAVYEHRLENAVIHCVRPMSDRAVAVRKAIEAGVQFFGLNGLTTQPEPPFAAPAELINHPAHTALDPEIRKQFLADQVDEALVDLFLTDLHASSYRGSVLGVEYTPAAGTQANHGFLVLRGQERAWLLVPESENATAKMHVVAASRPVFAEEVHRLVRVLDRPEASDDVARSEGTGGAH